MYRAFLTVAILSSFSTTSLAAQDSHNWYIGGEVGQAKTKVDNSNVRQFTEVTGVSADSLSFDEEDSALGLYLGYRFNDYVALELGYYDLGERSVSFKGEVADQATFNQEMGRIHPESGDGPTLAVSAGLPLGDNFRIDGQLGIFFWSGEYTTVDQQNPGVQINNEIESESEYVGIRLSYLMGQHWQLFGHYSHFSGAFNADGNNMLSLGVAYSF